MFHNQIYKTKNDEWVISIYPAEQAETKEVMIVYYGIGNKGKVLVSTKEEFLKNHEFHDGYASLKENI